MEDQIRLIIGQVVAVGTTIADRPPHRAVRAALPHTAPTLEDWREVLLLAHRSIHGTLHPRTVSGWCWLEQCSPWPAPFSPQAPPKIALPCSSGSSIVWRGPTPPKRARPPCGFYAFADRPRSLAGRGAPEVSRFSCMLFLSVRGFFDYAGPIARSRLSRNSRVAFLQSGESRRPGFAFFEAQ